MDELTKARHRKLVERINEQGWKADAESVVAEPVRLWLYSVSLEKGPRLVSQVGKELYRDMLNKGGLIAKARGLKLSPGDALDAFVREYDRKPGASESPKMKADLTLFLASYAISTVTWQIQKPITDVPGIHFFVFDWAPKRSPKERIYKPVSLYNAQPLSPSEVMPVQQYLMSKHLEKHPDDQP